MVMVMVEQRVILEVHRCVGSRCVHWRECLLPLWSDVSGGSLVYRRWIENLGLCRHWQSDK